MRRNCTQAHVGHNLSSQRHPFGHRYNMKPQIAIHMTNMSSFNIKMHPIVQLVLLFFAIPSTSASPPYGPYPSTTLVSPITKFMGPTTVYSITLTYNRLAVPSEISEVDRFIVDLDVPFTWDSRCKRVASERLYCSQPECVQARSYRAPGCIDTNNTQCYCHVTPVNPVTKKCAIGDFTYNFPQIYWTDGKYLLQLAEYYGKYLSCAPMSLMESLPTEAIGVVSLSWTSLSIVAQLTPDYLGISKKFALCLPRTPHTSRGMMFIGDGPYNINQSSSFDAETALSYTPLLKNPWMLGYYIGLSAIAVNGEPIRIPETAFAIDELGRSGVKLSVVVPYTTMRSDIFRLFLKKFRRAMKGIVLAENVAPFGLCFRTNGTKLEVPAIDLQFSNGTSWLIHGSNSIVQVSTILSCLAFVDGGETAEQAVVIGSYQMEDNFVIFDLVQSRFGFSSSLLPLGADCSNFNFTVGVGA